MDQVRAELKGSYAAPHLSHMEWVKKREESLIRLVKSSEGQIKFKVPQLERLMERYGFGSVNQKISNLTFRQILVSEFDFDDKKLMDHIWRVFDVNNSASITFREFALGLSRMLLGTYDEKLEFSFEVYNFGHRAITQHVMKLLLEDAIDDVEDDPEEASHAQQLLVELTLKKFDKEKGTTISLENFKRTIYEEPLLYECFGQVIPSDEAIEALMNEISV